MGNHLVATEGVENSKPKANEQTQANLSHHMGRDYSQPTAAGLIEMDMNDDYEENEDDFMIIDKEDVSDDEIREQIPAGSKIHVQ